MGLVVQVKADGIRVAYIQPTGGRKKAAKWTDLEDKRSCADLEDLWTGGTHCGRS